MNQFKLFAAAFAAHFATMSKDELYVVDIDGGSVWDAYLAEFPEGTNPLYRVRTVHDGSYDRNVVRKLGNVVRINADGTLTSVWDLSDLPHPYNVVCDALSSLVKSEPIISLFRTKEQNFGYVRTIEKLDDGRTHEWFHFHADVHAKHHDQMPDTVRGNARTTVEVLRRGCDELTPEAVATVLELIDQGALYRGAEFRPAVAQFQMIQRRYHDATNGGSPVDASIVLWKAQKSTAARIRNTAIGTLLQDLSEGVELERAVKSFETMVAPTNYKRPTALITQGMIDKALGIIDELGLRESLERRHAKLSDISVNNVLWVDNGARAHMRDGMRDLLSTALKPAKKPATASKNTTLGIDAFINDVLPTAIGLEIHFDNGLQSHLVSMTAPVHADAPPLFKWDNGFAWSYNGNITDSIKEKVKAAGGNVEATLRVSLAWFNYDDLDLHCECPDGHIYYANKRDILDVDMNAHTGRTRTPVENLAWNRPRDGWYTVAVNQFSRRETQDPGFVLELANDGKVTQYTYPKPVSSTVTAFKFKMAGNKVTEFELLNDDLLGKGIPQQVWGVTTETYIKVATVLVSPNHWDGHATGNKHWFFILEGCKNDDPVRGIYNEFLLPQLEEHRKVFEVLGNKTKCEPASEQLSGLGFSSTKRDEVTVRVTTPTSNRLYTIQF